MAELVAAGASKHAIAQALGCHRRSVDRAFKRLHIESTPPTSNGQGGEYSLTDGNGVSKHSRASNEPWGREDFELFLRERGEDPESVTFGYGFTTNPAGGVWNKLYDVRQKKGAETGPEWPVIQPAAPVVVQLESAPTKPARDGLLLSLKAGDTQIGYRAVGDTFEAFHDWSAILVFIEVCRREQPDTIVILGDFLDLAAQGKYVQEAGFARTTQMALNDGHHMLALLRAASPDARIVIVEGNHDKRMQSFIEQNALAAFGLKLANMPDSWPVMSLPNLLRLDELGIEYMDAYPAAAYWDDDTTRNIHGTRANSKGSTMSQYAHEAPHINTWAGHTHRQEIIYRTVIGPRGEPIESYSANPGALCHTDGRVPSVHGALHADGSSARVVEDWQQGFGSLLHGDGVSWPQVHRIRNGATIYNGQRIKAALAT